MTTLHLTPNASQKYILVSIPKDDAEIQVLWGNPSAEWHKDIADEIQASGIEIRKIMGGGRIKLDPEAKTIYVWGTSDRYGLAPKFAVEEILTTEFPDYTILFNKEPV